MFKSSTAVLVLIIVAGTSALTNVILEVNGVVVEGSRQSYLNVLSKIGRPESKTPLRARILRGSKIIELSTK